MASPSLRVLLAHPDCRSGMRDMAGLAPGIAAWALVTGVAMVKGGLPVPLALLMSIAMYAGSAQLAVVPLLALGAPVWVIWATALCVNLRFVIFSAQWRPYFIGFPLRARLLLGYLSGDISYVLFMKRYHQPRGEDAPGSAAREGQLAYFCGTAGVNYLVWQLASIAGIVLADAIPAVWSLGFAGTLALLGLVLALVSDRATLLAAGVAGTAAVAAFALPFKLHIVVAIAAAVGVGLMLDGGGDAGRRLRAWLAREDGRDLPPPGCQARAA